MAVRITGVEPGSPASRGKIREGETVKILKSN